MSDSATNTAKRKGWPIGDVIYATAHATVSAFFERLRADDWTRFPTAACGCPAPTGNARFSASDAEIKHLVRMHDELVKLLEHFEARAGDSKRQRRRLRQELRLISNLIARTLDRLQALSVVRMSFPEVADFRLHEPVRITPTNTLADDGRVTDVYINGFTSNGGVLRQSKIAVLKYVPKPESQPGKENQI